MGLSLDLVLPTHRAVVGTREGAGEREKRDVRVMDGRKRHFSMPQTKG